MNFNRQSYFLISFLSLMVLAACAKRPELEDLERGFYQQQAIFEALSETACTLKKALNIKWMLYKIDSTQQVDETLLSQFNRMDQLLSQIGSDHIVIQQMGEAECSLYIEQWSTAFGGNGANLGYSYQPATLAEYRPELYNGPNAEPYIHFTKPLLSGWYIEFSKH